MRTTAAAAAATIAIAITATGIYIGHSKKATAPQHQRQTNLDKY